MASSALATTRSRSTSWFVGTGVSMLALSLSPADLAARERRDALIAAGRIVAVAVVVAAGAAFAFGIGAGAAVVVAAVLLLAWLRRGGPAEPAAPVVTSRVASTFEAEATLVDEAPWEVAVEHGGGPLRIGVGVAQQVIAPRGEIFVRLAVVGPDGTTWESKGRTWAYVAADLPSGRVRLVLAASGTREMTVRLAATADAPIPAAA